MQPDNDSKTSIDEAFPELSELNGCDDEQRAETFSSVLRKLHTRLDEVTGQE